MPPATAAAMATMASASARSLQTKTLGLVVLRTIAAYW